ncbi:FAD-dependent oxidoreductase [uncultured Pedobacter sp.]|uniref:FAD-dependent oxidoreductase n=1 Tax=uncultured Pedobacter sp. TaxID=246139 RepID=UPI0025EC1315|nr:FAD-dependent oxidoreductase [uncultured Pedobacter sp.]
MNNNETAINTRDGANASMWQAASVNNPTTNHTDQEEIYDTLIIGGGITGVTTAYLLQKQGKHCALVEAKNLGFGTTGGTTAHLNTFLDTTYPEIDSDFNEETSSLIAEGTKKIIEMINTNVQELKINADFEFKTAYLFSQDEKETKELQSILTSSQAAGVEVSEAKENDVPIPFEQALRFENQAQFHPLKYILGLAEEFERLGGKIIEQTFIHSTELREEIHYAKSDEFILKAKTIVYATHIPPGINILSLRNAPYRSYVLAVKLNNGEYPDCLAYDMQEPYHYFRSHELDGQKYLIIGGADHKTGHGDPLKAFEDLEDYARKYFDISEITYKWSSQYYVPVDGLPYVGQLPGGDKGIYVATGFSGNGMILGSLSAVLISDLILEKENPYEKLFSPSRLKPIAGFTEFVKENADVAYHFVADRFGTQIINSTHELARNDGKIVEFDGEKLALYKDDAGKVTALNPVCTHAGCIVNWNPTEKTWDCPCHGGRFSVNGHVLTGPPQKGLEPVPINEITAANKNK